MKQITIKLGECNLVFQKQRENVWEFYVDGCSGRKWMQVAFNADLYGLTVHMRNAGYDVKYELI